MDFTVHFNYHRLIFKRNTEQCTLLQPIDYMDLESDYQAYDVLKDYEALLQELDSLKLDDAYFPDYFLVHEAERYFTMMIRTKHIEECGLKELSDTAKINNCFTTPVLTSSIALYHIYGRDTAFRIELQFSGKEALNTGSS